MNNPGAQQVMPGLQVLLFVLLLFPVRYWGSSCLASMLPSSQVSLAAPQAVSVPANNSATCPCRKGGDMVWAV